MNEILKINNEIQKRISVSQEKLAGWLIELIEKARLKDTANSIVIRVDELYKWVDCWAQCLASWSSLGQLNSYRINLSLILFNEAIQNYNCLVDDLQSNFRDKDKIVWQFKHLQKMSDFSELPEKISILLMRMSQIKGHLYRWL